MYQKIALCAVLTACSLTYSHAQCDQFTNYQVICPEFSGALGGNPTECFEVNDCIGLQSGHIIVSIDDTLLLDIIENDLFYASDYAVGSCIATLPMCYDLLAVQNLIDIVVSNNICCSILNSQIPGFCDTIRANFTSGADVQNLNDLVVVFQSLSTEPVNLQVLFDALQMINDNISAIEVFCSGVTVIGYCVDSIDFNSVEVGIYEINPDVCPFADCIDTIEIKPIFLSTNPHQSVFRAVDLITAEGLMLTDHEFRSENEVILKPDFAVEAGAMLDIVIEDCVTISIEGSTELLEKR